MAFEDVEKLSRVRQHQVRFGCLPAKGSSLRKWSRRGTFIAKLVNRPSGGGLIEAYEPGLESEHDLLDSWSNQLTDISKLCLE